MKKGDLVVCVDNSGQSDLVKGKVYTVTFKKDTESKMICVQLKGRVVEMNFWAVRFKLLEKLTPLAKVLYGVE